MSQSWCTVCCTTHEGMEHCPGELVATGPESPGWRVNVDTPSGIEAYGVLLAPCDELWRARVLTYPNVLWLVPGGRRTVKFVGATPQEAERRAIAFVLDHCRRRGFAFREERRARAEPTAPTAADAPRLPRPQGKPAPRRVRFLPVRFGVAAPTEAAGGTGNLSETGMFVITNAPVVPGSDLHLLLSLEPSESVRMSGIVRWKNDRPHVGRSPGMGIQLRTPPPRYVEYVRTLPG